MPAPDMNAPLLGCVTIDSATPDGYLDNARAGNPMAGASGDTRTAAGNLLACQGAKPGPTTAALVGHGAEGVIQTSRASNQVIGLVNESSWAPLLSPLAGRFTDLYLFGSEVGAGDDGAQLLYGIAQVIDAMVWAPTGLIYCRVDGSFVLENGAVWTCATPSMRPPPIPAPGPGVASSPFAPGSTQIRASLPGGKTTPRVTFETAGRVLDSKSTTALVAEVLWDQPFEPLGEPSGLITGRLRIGLPGGSADRSFVVYNHILLRDEAEPATFYRATPLFREIALGQ